MKRLFLALLLPAVLQPSPALACECAPETASPAASRANIERAAMIFEGEVLEITRRDFERRFIKRPQGAVSPDQNPQYARVVFSIKDIYKGQASDKVIAYLDILTSCGYNGLAKGQSGVWMLETIGGVLTAPGQCSSYISAADLRALQSGRFGQEPYGPPAPPETIRNAL